MTDLHLKFEGYELLEEDQAVLFARTLASNTTLRHLELDASFMEIGDKYLADVVRKKRNTTLQAFACSDKSLTSKINYFCLMNRLEPVLHSVDADRGRAIGLLEPYLSDTQMIFGLLRSRAGLWFQ